jgi:hypothetical protein
MMKTERLIGFVLLLLGAGMAANAILGPLLLGAIRSHVSPAMENQQIGGELISLFVAAPVALLAGVLWLRGHRLAPLLAIAPALYAVYTYVTFVLGPEYSRYPGNNERAFPLYLVLIVLGWAITSGCWPAMSRERLPALSTGLRRLLAGVLLAISLLFALAWLGSLVPVLRGGALPQSYSDDRTMFWLIRLLDLAFVIPASIIAALGLLRDAAWATRLAYVLIPFQTLLVGSVAGMAAVLLVRDDPAASPAMLAVTLGATAALGLMTVRLLSNARNTAAVTPRELRRPPAVSSRRPSSRATR